jgi:hypothetical protein
MPGADDLESVYFVLSPNSPYSAINSPNGGPAYQTQCDASTADIPQGSDLRPEGSMRFYDRGDGTIGVRVNVVNIGNQPANGASGRARIGTSTANAELHRYIDGTATAPNTVSPGGRGYIEVVLPPNALARCMQPQVVIDLDHTFQSGAPDPFANDTAEIWTQCVTWSRPISGDSLGFDPDPFLEGKTLGNIVGSSEVGRKDLKLCSQCHHEASGNKYSPPVPGDGSGSSIRQIRSAAPRGRLPADGRLGSSPTRSTNPTTSRSSSSSGSTTAPVLERASRSLGTGTPAPALLRGAELVEQRVEADAPRECRPRGRHRSTVLIRSAS